MQRSGGRVIDSNRIRYEPLACGTYSGNEFWDEAEARCDLPLTVNTIDDEDDGSCDGPHCSLREAINCANSRSGPDTISFGNFKRVQLTLSIEAERG